MSAANRFEGSFGGDAARIAPETRLECKICWHVYDPALGDEVRQIPPGTPFVALPADWRCPECDGERDQFMVLDAPAPAPAAETQAPAAEASAPAAEASAPAPVTPAPVTGAETSAAAAQATAEAARRAASAKVQAVFTEIFNAKMRGTPLINAALTVESVGFRAWDGGWLGVLVAPWFMNLILLPGAAASGEAPDLAEAKVGDKRVFAFPSGAYEFVFNHRPELGPYWACSLFSPMNEFPSQLAATDVAHAVMAALFDAANRCEDGSRDGEIRAEREAQRAAEEATEEAAEASEAAPDGAPPGPLSRRAFLSGGAASEPAP